MKKYIILILILASTVISGCLLISINPYYTPDTLVRLDNLEGKWIDKDSISWNFELDTTSLYKLTIDETIPKRKKALEDTVPILDNNLFEKLLEMVIFDFRAGVTLIEGNYFLDLLPEKASGFSAFHSQHFIYGHSISKIKLKGDTLWMSLLKDEWVKELNDKEKKKIGCIENEKNLVLTASTKKLRNFIKKYANDNEVFPEKHVLVRAK